MALGTGRTWLRILAGALVVAAIAVGTWIVRLPNMAECRASGRVVDPTERHCESGGPAAYQQLQEHATMHAVQVVIYAFLALTGAYVIYRLVRRLTAAKRVA